MGKGHRASSAAGRTRPSHRSNDANLGASLACLKPETTQIQTDQNLRYGQVGLGLGIEHDEKGEVI